MPAITHLVRPDIRELEPYVPIVPHDILAQRLNIPVERIIKLDANENPYGPSVAVFEALQSCTHYAIYPDPDHTRLRAALSCYTNQPPERIMCGSGADELIDLLLRLFLVPGDRVINCPPTFGMYEFDTAVCGGQVIDVQRRADFSLDIAAIEHAWIETQAKVLFLTSPNNPSGNVTLLADIEQLLALPLLVVVDEAYIEFTDHPRGVSHLLDHYENLVILRTFSKWAGLAGLRLGYALLPEHIAVHLWKIKQPYNVNVAAEVAALASLGALDELRANIARIVGERERMVAALGLVPYLQVYPSQANFILCRVVQHDAHIIKQTLEREGIIIRYYRKSGLEDCIRLTIGKPEHNDAVLQALHQLEH